jgi:NADH:ubiquinone oxidoreductase subunit D
MRKKAVAAARRDRWRGEIVERANPDIDLLLPSTDEVIEDTTLSQALLYFDRPDQPGTPARPYSSPF